MTRRRLILIAALFLAAMSVIYWLWSERRERRQDAPIRAAAQRYGVDAALIKAVVWRESRFDPTVRGHAQEIGLMQLQEAAAQEWADAEHIVGFDHGHCFDPGTNTLAGAWYLKKLLRRYAKTDNPIPYALADFNAGRANVLKWNHGAAGTNSAEFVAQIGFPSTKSYVESVIKRYKRYRSIFN